MLDEPGNQLELGLTLRTSKLVLIVRRRVEMTVKACKSSEGLGTEIALVLRAVEGSLGGDVSMHGSRRACNPFDGNIGNDLQRANRSSYLVAGNFVASRFDVEGDTRGTLEHPATERTFEIAFTMGKRVLVLRIMSEY